MASPDLFTEHADDYSKSQSHAEGGDLLTLMRNLPGLKNAASIDLATGTGFTAVRISERSKFVIAFDKTEEMMSQARLLASGKNLDNIIFVLGDVENVPFLSNTFDLATCRRAAHHFQHKARFLAETFRILKHGGYFGFVDMIAPEMDTEDLFNKMEIIRDPSHVGAESFISWKKLIIESGFEITFSEVQEERVSFEKWLSPVKRESAEGTACVKLLEQNKSYFHERIGFDGNSFIKSRGVIISRKP